MPNYRLFLLAVNQNLSENCKISRLHPPHMGGAFVWENDMLGKKSYLKETGGTVAVNFALGLTALVAVIGAAVDLSLINSQKSKMQNLADSTALAAAVSGNTTLAELQLFADEFVKSSTLPDANAKVMLNNGNVLVELTKEKNLLISKALPGGKADLFADSEVPYAGQPCSVLKLCTASSLICRRALARSSDEDCRSR